MTKGKLLPERTLILREAQQHGTVTINGEEHDISLTTVIGGKNTGMPIVSVKGSQVSWDAEEMMDEAIGIFQEEGILPKEVEDVDE